MAPRIRKSSANLFRELDFEPGQAESLRIRSDLMIRVVKLITTSGWTQRGAARILGVTQPRVSDLVRAKIDRFSIDSLIEMLGRAGIGVRVTLRRRSRVA